jgi:hypothetical protein
MLANLPNCCLHVLWNIAWHCKFLASNKELFTTRCPNLKLLVYHLKVSFLWVKCQLLFPICRGPWEITLSLSSKPWVITLLLNCKMLLYQKTLPLSQIIVNCGELYPKCGPIHVRDRKLHQEYNPGGLPTQVCCAYQSIVYDCTLLQR